MERYSNGAKKLLVSGHVITAISEGTQPIHEKRHFQFDESWLSPEPTIQGEDGVTLSLIVAQIKDESIFAVRGRERPDDLFPHFVATLDGTVEFRAKSTEDMEESPSWTQARLAPPSVITAYMDWRNH
jgi:hypothetical protein